MAPSGSSIFRQQGEDRDLLKAVVTDRSRYRWSEIGAAPPAPRIGGPLLDPPLALDGGSIWTPIEHYSDAAETSPSAHDEHRCSERQGAMSDAVVAGADGSLEVPRDATGQPVAGLGEDARLAHLGADIDIRRQKPNEKDAHPTPNSDAKSRKKRARARISQLMASPNICRFL